MILDVKSVKSEKYELEMLKMFPEFELPVVKASKTTILGKILQTDQNKEATELQKKSDKKQFHISKLILKKPQLEKDFRKWPI